MSALSQKQTWQRQSVDSDFVNYIKCLTQNFFRAGTVATERSDRCSSFSDNSTEQAIARNSVKNGLGSKLWSTTGDMSRDCGMKSPEENLESIKSSKAMRGDTRFHPAVRVVLIPTRDEYTSAGLASALWWGEKEYCTFKSDAIGELRECMGRLNCTSKDAIHSLYQSCVLEDCQLCANVNQNSPEREMEKKHLSPGARTDSLLLLQKLGGKLSQFQSDRRNKIRDDSDSSNESHTSDGDYSTTSTTSRSGTSASENCDFPSHCTENGNEHKFAGEEYARDAGIFSAQEWKANLGASIDEDDASGLTSDDEGCDDEDVDIHIKKRTPVSGEHHSKNRQRKHVHAHRLDVQLPKDASILHLALGPSTGSIAPVPDESVHQDSEREVRDIICSEGLHGDGATSAADVRSDCSTPCAPIAGAIAIGSEDDDSSCSDEGPTCFYDSDSWRDRMDWSNGWGNWGLGIGK